MKHNHIVLLLAFSSLIWACNSQHKTDESKAGETGTASVPLNTTTAPEVPTAIATATPTPLATQPGPMQ